MFKLCNKPWNSNTTIGGLYGTTTTTQHAKKELPMQLRCRRNEIAENPVHLTMLRPATVMVMGSYGRWLCVHPTTFGCLFSSVF